MACRRYVQHCSAVVQTTVLYSCCPFTLGHSKTRATYVKTLLELKSVQPGFRPTCLMSEFEQVAMQAGEYEADHKFAQWIKILPTLAFVEPDNVVPAYEKLTKSDQFPDEAMPIANYFEEMLSLEDRCDVADVSECCMEGSSADVRWTTKHQ
ncbi:hypothetical protein HELRODRAFT_169475 [Helobdella robusta]|uniref:Uncharacterized protein n=1 Tax=Helobdella robusta TaxID=6412 RepID=T1F1Z7_HELRO|nr:hypothetical protein HELRODRAFT_169475 [Helobdella robusta]ESO08599.1 hypothetical protein HELRODRAFT_169475 [Helobdella robusta]